MGVPEELFSSAPDLPPCGRNQNAARTYADVRSADDSTLQTLCALGSAGQLQQLGFAIPSDQLPPAEVYVVLLDRRTGKEYRSNRVRLEANPLEPTTRQLDRMSYERRLREEILEQVRMADIPVDEFRVEVVRGILTRPRHGDFHRPVGVVGGDGAFVRGQVISYSDAWQKGQALTFQVTAETSGQTRTVRVDPKGGFRLGYIDSGRQMVHLLIPRRQVFDCLLFVAAREVRSISLMLNSAGENGPVRCSISTAATSVFPEALGLLAIYRRGEFQGTRFAEFTADGKPFGDYPQPPVRLPSETPMSEPEWQQVLRFLDDFYSVAADISRDEKRFYQFLPADMKRYRVGEKCEFTWMGLPMSQTEQTSNEELRRVVAMALDATALGTWADLEGLASSTYEGLVPQGWNSSPEKLRAAIEHVSMSVRKDLREFGALEPRHAGLVRPYIELYFGRERFEKIELNRTEKGKFDQALCGWSFPVLYRSTFGGLALYFAKMDGRLVLVFAGAED